MEYFKDNDFFEKMEKVAVPKLDAARTSGYYTAYDGIKIYYDKFKNKNEKAIIVISHGFCEFAEKFEEVIYCARDTRYIFRSTEGMAILTGRLMICQRYM